MADVNNPPAGGFQEGGWYWDPSINQARQYSKATGFGAGTTINNPNQVGYGQTVSKDVQAQSGFVATPTVDTNNNANGANASLGGSGVSPTSTINLQNIYDQAYASAGVTKLQDQVNAIQTKIDTRNKALSDAKANINENPFYSEGNRTGVIAKLEADAQNDLNNLTNQKAVLQGQVDSAKADVETKLNIATKQFDINSSAATQALTQFNTLLTAGALDNASASDIASFASATGISTSMINSAIKLSQAKNVESKMIETTDDNGNVTVSLVQIKDGQMSVVSKQSLGSIGKSSGSGTSTSALKMQAIGDATAVLDSMKNSYGHVDPAQWAQVRSAALQSGLTAQEFNSNFSSYTDPNRADFNSSYGFDIKSRGANQYQILNQGS